ncbi:MAG: hypothetical protein RJA33_55 [Actinomycetota bacterium]|jgi:outer membrane lipoprotein-sorting protein
MSRNRRRWIPAILAPVLVAGSVVGFSVQATAAVDLPDKSAAQILAMINTNPDLAFTGRIVKKADMGLPPMNIVPDISQSMIDEMAKKMPKEMGDFLPKASAQGEIALALEFFAGTHTANIYVDGAEKVRLQVLDLLSERDYIRNGDQLWAYDAGKSLAEKSVIDPREEAAAEREARDLFDTYKSEIPFDYTSPAAAAEFILAEAGPDATIAVGSDAKIAGRGVYQLTVTPNSDDTLIAYATIFIDGANGLPLAAAVYAKGKTAPAFNVTFTEITFETPAASNFEFVPPVGTRIIERALPTRAQLEAEASKQSLPLTESEARAELDALKAQGWGAVATIESEQLPAELSALIGNNDLYLDLTKKVEGGRVFTSALLNIFIADNGDVYAGSVTVARLLEVAATK